MRITEQQFTKARPRKRNSFTFSQAVLISLILHGIILVFWAMVFQCDDDYQPSAPILFLKELPSTAPSVNLSTSIASHSSKGQSKPPASSPPMKTDKELPKALLESSGSFDVSPVRSILPTHLAPLSAALSQRLHQAELPIASIFPMSEKQEKFLMNQVEKFCRKVYQIESDTIVFWQYRQQNYRVKVTKQKNRSKTGLEKFVFDISTSMNGQPARTRIKMRRLAFSCYAQFVDEWDPKIMLHNDRLYGRFHSNSSFRISQFGRIRPEFHGKVTTASYQIKTNKNFFLFNTSNIFPEGLERGVRSIHLPEKLSTLLQKETIDSRWMKVFKKETWISFQENGTFRWYTKSAIGKSCVRNIPDDEPFFILGKSKAKIHVKGIVKGQILVLTENDLIIDGDLLYAHSLENRSIGDDFLGLVSQRDVKIAPPEVTGNGDLCLCAAIYAHRTFEVTELYGPDEATLHLFGSLSAGTISATEPRYATRIVFDPRLENQRPPCFPQTDHYEVISWSRLWQLTALE